MNNRLAKIIPKLIFPNQSEFVKGKSIRKNVLLAQKIINDIRKPNKGENIMFKGDMNKACDRESWNFVCVVMGEIGFYEE